MRLVLFSCLLLSGAAAADKPAAVQVCFKAPAGTELFSSSARPSFRSIGNGTWMLDFDLLLDGQLPEKVTKAGPSCVRAWLAPRPVKQVSVSFERVPLNYVAAPRAVDLKLKPDLWFDAGLVLLEQEPFAVAHQRVAGELTFERKTAAGLVKEKPDALPVGEYVVTWAPAPAPTHPCTARLEVVTMGTVSKEKDPGFVKELSAHYEETMLPTALQQRGLSCTDAEEVLAEVLLVDGVFIRPLQPKLRKVVVPAKQTVFELRHDGRELRLDEPVTLTIGAGQVLELVAKPPSLAAR